MQHQLPKLDYAYDALEPHIDQLTMEIHYSRHHAAYVNNLNNALENYKDLQALSLEELLKSLDQLPESIYWPVRNNGGGHFNHTLFWSLLSPNGGGHPSGELAEKIKDTFGTFEQFQDLFNKAALSRFGSGWAWLVLHPDGSISVVSTPNQDNPVSDGLQPILGLDVWEHAYYLKYMNKRPDYINAWWNVVNWDAVEKRYQLLKK
ncbi:superoxide dismutase [Geosporobacter ferrireducens]|uniref:Superoxide dismutase n=1 Tax=Geosporobacter ferrireducens TaxID=1424294 RepID=A0A1D8GHB4_9FIRM|nr:superoxide dismutase [Geosporobacter ferrireducens]AOT70305.1 superoxide dismutase [Geosporobacter ferrireducens]MTI54273.1 superoxide dismutase [Geosporobacter ferrireducens]